MPDLSPARLPAHLHEAAPKGVRRQRLPLVHNCLRKGGWQGRVAR